jgi:hypothetical protein
MMDSSVSKKVSQFGSPAVMQWLSAPLHLLGLDLYNRPVSSAAAHVSFMSREYVPTALARTARIGPAFGIGGVGNIYFRDNLRTHLYKF